ncbi:MAG: hypothetical protein NTX03_12805 [Bacteroidetes bacterium]|nr:hypothetical protein [Bacteroidota bacterium]
MQEELLQFNTQSADLLEAEDLNENAIKNMGGDEDDLGLDDTPEDEDLMFGGEGYDEEDFGDFELDDKADEKDDFDAEDDAFDDEDWEDEGNEED